MDISLLQLQFFLRTLTCGFLLLLVCKLVLNDRHLIAARWLALVFVGLAGYLMLPFLDNWRLLHELAVVFASCVPPAFWLFARALFIEQSSSSRVSWPLLLALVSFVVSYGLDFTAHSNCCDGLWVALLFYLSYAFKIGFVVLTLIAILAEWRDDLLESRRQLRSVMFTLGGSYMLGVLIVELLWRNQPVSQWVELLHTLGLLLIHFAIALWLLVINPNGLQPWRASAVPEADAEEVDPQLPLLEQRWLRTLQQFMEERQGYRDGSLSIAGLGKQLAIPEHRLRALINRHLGYRNFNQYLNQYRLADAARQLQNPTLANTAVINIAHDAGFASLAPFNRAFKAEFKQTPSDFRRQHLSG